MEPGEDIVATWRAAAATYATEVARARQAGIDLSASRKTTRLPPAQNAATHYRRMAVVEDDADPSTKTLLAFLSHDAPTAAQIQRARQAVGRSRQLRFAHDAVALPRCDFERVPDQPAPHLAVLRQAVRLLTAQSLLLAHQGRTAQAVGNQRLAFRVVRHAAAGQSLIDYLVALAVDAIALMGLERILAIRRGEATTAAAIAQLLQQAWRVPALAPALAAEAAWQQKELTRVRQEGVLAYLQRSVDAMYESFPAQTAAQKAEREQERTQMRAQWEKSLPRAALQDRANEKALLDASAAFQIGWMRQLHAAADQPYPRSRRVFAAFARDLDATSSMPEGQRAIRRIPALLMGTLANLAENRPMGWRGDGPCSPARGFWRSGRSERFLTPWRIFPGTRSAVVRCAIAGRDRGRGRDS